VCHKRRLNEADSGDETASRPSSPNWNLSQMRTRSHDQARTHQVGSLISLLGGILTLLPSLTAVPHVEKKHQVLEGHATGASEGRRYHEDTNADRWDMRGITSH
jgi:hypothetical protein